jgi:hypothetical protein
MLYVFKLKRTSRNAFCIKNFQTKLWKTVAEEGEGEE